MSHDPFSGVMTALVTPFHKNKEIDFKSFHKIIEHQKKSGIHGIVILGTTGENPTLTEQESESLVLEALEHQTDDFHIYVGTGTNDTASTVKKSLYFANLKSKSHKQANGIMVVTPYYNKPTQQHLINHYKEVCTQIKNTPVCLYNVPGRTGINIQAKTFSKIAFENENIVAIKEAAGNVNAISEIRLELNKIGKNRVRILSGDDATFCPALLCGANGVISVTTHIIPITMLEILNAIKEGNAKRACELHLKSYSINNGVFCTPNPVGIKWLLSQLNMCENVLRAPLYPAEGDEVEKLNDILLSSRDLIAGSIP